MYTLNQLTIIGFIGNDAESHYTANGTLVSRFRSQPKNHGKMQMANGKAVPTGIGSFPSRALLSTAAYPRRDPTCWVQGAVRTREYERDSVKHRVVEVRADTIGKLDCAERRLESGVDPDTSDA